MQNEKKTNSRDNNTAGSRTMVGFRCTQEVKQRLTREASENGKTLGGYIEDLVSAPRVKTEEYIPSNDDTPTDFSVQQRNIELTKELNEVKKKYDWAQQKLDVFNSPKLLELYNSNKGKMGSFINDAGKKVALRIEHPADVITILSNLFKSQA